MPMEEDKTNVPYEKKKQEANEEFDKLIFFD